MIELILALNALFIAFGAFYLMWWHVFKETNEMFNTHRSERVKTLPGNTVVDQRMQRRLDSIITSAQMEAFYGSLGGDFSDSKPQYVNKKTRKDYDYLDGEIL